MHEGHTYTDIYPFFSVYIINQLIHAVYYICLSIKLHGILKQFLITVGTEWLSCIVVDGNGQK